MMYIVSSLADLGGAYCGDLPLTACYVVELLVTDATTAKAILHCTHPVSHVIFWFIGNHQRPSKLLF